MDQLAHAAGRAGARCDAEPRWVDTPFGGQYIGDDDVGGVVVEFSTVELSAPDPARIAECTGDSPWLHFDTIDVDGYPVALVASELRLQSEVLRDRADRWVPIAAFLAERGHDEHLLGAALASVPPDTQRNET